MAWYSSRLRCRCCWPPLTAGLASWSSRGADPSRRLLYRAAIFVTERSEREKNRIGITRLVRYCNAPSLHGRMNLKRHEHEAGPWWSSRKGGSWPSEKRYEDDRPVTSQCWSWSLSPPPRYPPAQCFPVHK